MASESESGSEYEVIKVLQQRRRKGATEYLVRWSGFGPQEDSWEKESRLKNCTKLIQDFLKSGMTPKKTTKRASRSRSSSRSRSRSRSRGRGSSRSRKSPARKKVATPPRETTVSVRQSRSSAAAAGLLQQTTTTTTKSVEEVKPILNNAEEVKRRVVQETVKTVTTTRESKPERENKVRPAWEPQLPEFLRLTTSDVPIMIIFTCITIITLSFILEKFVDFEAVWNYFAGLCDAVVTQIQSLFSRGGETAVPKKG